MQKLSKLDCEASLIEEPFLMQIHKKAALLLLLNYFFLLNPLIKVLNVTNLCHIGYFITKGKVPYGIKIDKKLCPKYFFLLFKD